MAKRPAGESGDLKIINSTLKEMRYGDVREQGH